MSEAQQSQPADMPDLDEAQVAAWLVAHPDFVSRHPEAFEAQNVAHESPGAASLIERQVARLRETNRELATRFEELVATARANEERVVELNRVARIMVGADTVDPMIDALASALKQHMAVDEVCVALESVPEAGARRIVALDGHPAASEALTHVIRRGKPICGEITAGQAAALFTDNDDALLTSAAFIPLGRSRVRGAIVLASRDPQRFVPDTGTLFIELFGSLMTATLARLLGEDALA